MAGKSKTIILGKQNMKKIIKMQETMTEAQRYTRYKAFTLAEVLITLGIIGVVAAMTIPTLIQNQQKQETISRLKKMYSTISQSAKMSEVENGSISSWAYPTIDWDDTQSQVFWNTYFIPYSNLSVIKECTTVNRFECWASDAKYLDGSTNSGSGYIYWVLKDGSCVSLSSASSTQAQIFVDINGQKKPNVSGKDIFYLVIDKIKGSVLLAGTTYGKTYLLEDHNATCNKSAGFMKGTYCGAIIQLDGWEIKDDYPW